MFRFDEWANARVLDALAVMPVPSVWYDQARAYFAHILWSQTLWIGRVRKTGGELPDVPGNLSLDEFRARMTHLAEQWRAVTDPLRPAQLAAPLSYRRTEGDAKTATLHAMLAHVTAHGVHHRAQICTAIRNGHGTPPEIDFIAYALSHPHEFGIYLESRFS